MHNRDVARLAVIALALVACGGPAVVPSPTPPAPAPTPTASSVATSTAPPSADPTRYGLVVPGAGRTIVRSERSTDAVLAIAGDQAAPSHDGKRIAFWRTRPEGGNPHELRIAEIPVGTERLLTALPAGVGGGAIAWSNDDTGLLYAVHSLEPVTAVGAGPRFSRLQSIDVAAAPAPAVTSELVLGAGRVFMPLAWDRPAQIASALTTGEGGMALEYVTWDRKMPPGQGATKSTPFPWPVFAGTVRASHDATRVLAIDGDANALRIWPVADIGASDMVSPGAGRITDAWWRPRPAADVAWVVDQNVSVLTYQTSSVRTVYRAPAMVLIMAWRVDGSGLILYEQGRGPLVVEIASLQVVTLAGGGEATGGAVLLR